MINSYAEDEEEWEDEDEEGEGEEGRMSNEAKCSGMYAAAVLNDKGRHTMPRVER